MVINYETCDLHVCFMSGNCLELYSSTIIFLDYMILFCSIDTSQGNCVHATLFHYKPFYQTYSWVDKASDLCIFSVLHMMLWTHNLLMFCPWFVACATNFHLAKEEALRLSLLPSQELEEKMKEEPKSSGRGSICNPKINKN